MDTVIWIGFGIGLLLALTWLTSRIRSWLGTDRTRPQSHGQAMDEAEFLTRGKGPFV